MSKSAPVAEKSANTTTLDKLVTLTGLDAARIRKATVAGYFPAPKRGEFETLPTIKGLFKHLTDELSKRGRPPKGDQTFPIYESSKICAAVTGLPTALLRLCNSLGCDAFRFRRVDLGKLLRFVGEHFKFIEKTAKEKLLDNTTGSRSEWEHWKAKREKIRYERDALISIPIDEASYDVQQALGIHYAEMDRIFCNELPPALCGMEALEIRARCRQACDEQKAALRARFMAAVKAPETGKINEDQSEKITTTDHHRHD